MPFALWRLLRNVLAILLWPIRTLARLGRGTKPTWLEVSLKGRWPEVATPRAFWDPRPRPSTLQGLRRTLAAAAEDDDVEGVVFSIENLHAGWAGCESIREAMRKLATRGKRTIAFLPGGGATREYFVATACQEIHLPPAATLFVLGLAREVPYLKDALARIGARAEILAAGDYKSAGDMLSRSDMSPADREQTEALLEAIWSELVNGIAEGRRLGRDAVRAAIDEAPLRPEAARQRGLVDSISYDDELRHQITGDRGRDGVRFVSAAKWQRAQDARPVWKPLRPGPIVAVIEVSGPIVSHAGSVLVGRVAAAEQFVKTARAVHRSKRVCGVVVHVESGGGSALASDEMHHAIARLREAHPVCVSFGDVAASGGYYLAVAGERIFARPTTITGSIGVVTGKLDVSGTLSRLRIGRAVIARGEHATLLSASKGLTESERAALGRELQQMYELFVKRVADGRARTPEDVLRLAGGRVWAGKDAHQRGLVDDLGGLPAAIAWVRERAGARGALAEVAVAAAPAQSHIPPVPLPVPKSVANLVELARLAGSDRMLFVSPLDLEGIAWD